MILKITVLAYFYRPFLACILSIDHTTKSQTMFENVKKEIFENPYGLPVDDEIELDHSGVSVELVASDTLATNDRTKVNCDKCEICNVSVTNLDKHITETHVVCHLCNKQLNITK